MRVMITGGGGFIGVWIAARLARLGLDVRVLDIAARPALSHEILGPLADSIEWRSGDVADPDVVSEAACDCELLIHLAALLTPACQAQPLHGARVNLLGTLNVFEAARLHGIAKVLYMSSAGVFGPHDGMTPKPTTLYGAYKLAGEGCARVYFLDHGISSAGFRPLVVYGPGRESGLTAGPSLACRAAAQGNAYCIGFTGDSDFVFVDDVAAAFEAAALAELAGAHVYNVVGERACVEDLLATIRAAVPGARISARGPGLPVAAAIEDGELRREFPSVARTSLAEGVKRTVAHYRSR